MAATAAAPPKLVTYIRTGKKGAYSYVGPGGAVVKDARLLAYFDSLRIPPAYNDVRIFWAGPVVQPKILYVGIDAAGREQPHYSPEHVVAATQRKFSELLTFARQVPAITAAVVAALKSPGETVGKAIALTLRLMMTCHFRIGNERFYDRYGSAGARNVRKKHLKIAANGKSAQMTFPGKKGVINTCMITDATLLAELKSRARMLDDEDMLFTYVDAGGARLAPTAIEVNAWLKEFDPALTSKQFRTYDANMMLLMYLCNAGDPVKKTAAARKAIVREAMIEIATRLHNTPAITKKNYIHSGIIEMYVESPAAFAAAFMDDAVPSLRERFITFLESA